MQISKIQAERILTDLNILAAAYEGEASGDSLPLDSLDISIAALSPLESTQAQALKRTVDFFQTQEAEALAYYRTQILNKTGLPGEDSLAIEDYDSRVKPVPPQEIFNQYAGGIFDIFIPFTNDNWGTSYATGWIIAKFPQLDGSFKYHVVTNAHVAGSSIYGLEPTSFVLRNANGQFSDVNFFGTDIRTDVAILEFVSQEDLPVLPMADSTNEAVGEDLWIIGNNDGRGQGLQHLTKIGDHSGFTYQLDYFGFHQSESSRVAGNVRGGNSGSPVFNGQGEVVEMHFAGGGGTGADVPISDVKASYEKIEASRSGHQGTHVTDWGFYAQVELQFENDDWRNVFVVRNVFDNTLPIQSGDFVLKVTDANGGVIWIAENCRTTSGFLGFLADTAAEKPYSVTVERNGQMQVLSITPRKLEIPAPSLFETNLGFFVLDLDIFWRRRLGLGDEVQGVLVYNYSANWGDTTQPGPVSSQIPSLYPGMIITHVNGEIVDDVSAFREKFTAFRKSGEDISFTVCLTPEFLRNEIAVNANMSFAQGGMGQTRTITITGNPQKDL